MQHRFQFLVLGMLFCLFNGCTNDFSEKQKLLLGEWCAVTADSYDGLTQDLTFYPKDQIESQVGFWSVYHYSFNAKTSTLLEQRYFGYSKARRYKISDKIDGQYQDFVIGHDSLGQKRLFSSELLEDSNRSRRMVFAGTKSTYRFMGKYLQIYDIGFRVWINYTIKKLTQDTLILAVNETKPFSHNLGDGKHQTIFKRQLPPKQQKTDWDALMFSVGPCFGPCPVMDGIIKKDGTFIFKGDAHTDSVGIFIQKLPPSIMQTLQNKLNRIDFSTIQDHYEANVTDHQSMYISIMRDGKIIKNVDDYGYVAPKEFEWAMAYIRYLYQLVKLQRTKTLANSHLIPFSSDIFLDWLPSPHRQRIRWFSSNLWLWYLLQTGAIVDHHPTFSHTLKASERDREGELKYYFIPTDGRYFQVTNKEGKKEVIDVGYNLLEMEYPRSK